MNWMPKILPADVIGPPSFDDFTDIVKPGNSDVIIALLIALLVIAGIVTIIVAVARSKRCNPKDISDKTTADDTDDTSSCGE